MRPLITAVLAVALVLPHPASAVWSGLNEQQVQEALSLATAAYERWRKEGGAIDDVDREYLVSLGPDTGSAILFTEFSTLTLEHRRWLAIGRKIEPKEIELIAERFRNQFKFSVTLVGESRDFLRQYQVRLLQSGVSREPLKAEVFRGVRQGTSNRWVALGEYTFSVEKLDLAGALSLVCQTAGGKEIRFEFDLSRLR
ncbi:MAG: hypothetical protein HYV93_22455 [Candidatus Rokubacteria bacterium]|nr:hypothetical protein [Candidatus Rokubacteria bacterium]